MSLMHYAHNILDTTIRDHTDSSLKKRAPNVRKLANKYNAFVAQANENAETFNYPKEQIPAPLDVQHLYDLDANAHMWAASAILSQTNEFPPYLIDEGVRKGISAFQVLDRAREESIRLCEELRIMIKWLQAEIHGVDNALSQCEGILFHHL